MRLRVWGCGLVWLAAALPVTAQQPAPEIESIRQQDLRADLFYLAGDGFRGRLTNTPENLLAAEFIRARFERLGLEPAGPGGSYFQPYTLMIATLGAENRLVASTGDGVERRATVGIDVYPHRFSATGRTGGAVVFAGFGITEPRLGYDDYRGEQIKGNVVLVLDHEPGERDPDSPFDGVVTAQASSPLEKALAAQARGAAGILFVTDVHNHPGPANFGEAARNYWPAEAPRVERYTLGSLAERVRIPAAQISATLADALVRGTGRTLAELSRAAESPRGMVPVPVPGVQVELTTTVHQQVIPDRNVVARVVGADPRLKDDWVIVSAHFDHDGASGEQVYNGADDDGSGTVGLLEIAEDLRPRPRTGATAPPVGALRRVELRGARPARGVGVCRTTAVPAGPDRRRPQHGHDRSQRRGAGRRRRPIPGPGGSDGGVQ